MWNPTIPPDQKFSTVITKIPGPCSSQSQRSRHQLAKDQAEDPPAENIIQLYTLQQEVTSGLWKTEEADIHILLTSSGE